MVEEEEEEGEEDEEDDAIPWRAAEPAASRGVLFCRVLSTAMVVGIKQNDELEKDDDGCVSLSAFSFSVVVLDCLVAEVARWWSCSRDDDDDDDDNESEHDDDDSENDVAHDDEAAAAA